MKFININIHHFEKQILIHYFTMKLVATILGGNRKAKLINRVGELKFNYYEKIRILKRE